MSKALTKQGSLMPTFFEDLFSPWNNIVENMRFFPNSFQSPAVNIVSTNGDYQLTMAVPGMKKDDFKIDFDDSLLTISCSKEENMEEKNQKFTRKEFNYSSFTRTFTIPNEINVDKIEANYVDGLLKIRLPIKEEFKHVSPQKHITVK